MVGVGLDAILDKSTDKNLVPVWPLAIGIVPYVDSSIDVIVVAKAV